MDRSSFVVKRWRSGCPVWGPSRSRWLREAPGRMAISNRSTVGCVTGSGPSFGAGRRRCWHPARRIRGDNARYPDRAASCEQGIGPGISADPARQVFVTSRLDRSTASGGESRGDPDSARADSRAIGDHRRRLDRDSKAIRSSVQDSRRPTRCTAALAAREGNAWLRAAMPLPWPFDSRKLDHQASQTDRWTAPDSIVEQLQCASLHGISPRNALRELRFEPAAGALMRIALAAKLDDHGHGCP